MKQKAQISEVQMLQNYFDSVLEVLTEKAIKLGAFDGCFTNSIGNLASFP